MCVCVWGGVPWGPRPPRGSGPPDPLWAGPGRVGEPALRCRTRRPQKRGRQVMCGGSGLGGAQVRSRRAGSAARVTPVRGGAPWEGGLCVRSVRQAAASAGLPAVPSHGGAAAGGAGQRRAGHGGRARVGTPGCGRFWQQPAGFGCLQQLDEGVVVRGGAGVRPFPHSASGGAAGRAVAGRWLPLRCHQQPVRPGLLKQTASPR